MSATPSICAMYCHHRGKEDPVEHRTDSNSDIKKRVRSTATFQAIGPSAVAVIWMRGAGACHWDQGETWQACMQQYKQYGHDDGEYCFENNGRQQGTSPESLRTGVPVSFSCSLGAGSSI